jgi:cytochrome o ubiquinol oxidase subunit 2
MKPSSKLTLGALSVVLAAIFFRLLVGDSVVALLEPRGIIASRELQVLLKMTGVMLVLAIPLLALFYGLAWKYRADNPHTEYDPDRTGSAKAQLMIWAIPAIFIAVLWGITWKSAHWLDPYSPIKSDKPPITIQVVALRWKWLFIYPQQGIATTALIEFPENTPVHFELTADAPMSSFWIPQLGSQIYAMAGMKTQLNLIAEKGDYTGRDTEINGQGYEGMVFDAKAVSQSDFDAWVQRTRLSSVVLDAETYAKLAVPSRNDPPLIYAGVEPNLFGTIMMNGDTSSKHKVGPAPDETEPKETEKPMNGM